MVLLLAEKDLRQSLTMDEAIQCTETAFKEYHSGRLLMPPRMAVDLRSTAGSLRVMSASLPYLGRFGLKTLTGVPGKRDPHESYFMVLLFDLKDGKVLSLMAGDYLTRVRTGAATGVATKYLSRNDSKSLGLFGAGVQAETQVLAISCVRSLSTVKIYDLYENKAQELAKSIGNKLKAEIEIVDKPQIAAANTDILVAVTTSKEPVIRGELLRAGVHVNSVGANSPQKKEIDPQGFKISKIVVDFKDQVLEEAGDLRDAVASGAITVEDIYGELGEIVSGVKPGRTNKDEITLFKSVGIAIEDVAVATKAYENALRKGLGKNITLSD